jgi:GTP-binding protein LepA
LRCRSLTRRTRLTSCFATSQVAIQACVGGKVIASEHIPPFRKDVTSKCYGGHIGRKQKLLNKQKRGKKRMKRFGKVTLPQSAFMSVCAREP